MNKYLVQWHSPMSGLYGNRLVEAPSWDAAIIFARNEFAANISILGAVCISIPLEAQGQLLNTIINNFAV